ncbi:hypothetical protein DIS18_11660 [Algibacter marinivivus]|uniref:STAS/SEC14 domain-containing protein n=1 Tax=Algibacter marinivivus TaxID=2100723 RepID=A0A2U2X2E2_9FLAO|nr:hypothetical protein [Algibacter marinivivus]PWH81919.1 hypothetical protein DIS18_11660 [Algibacter marinivivus]
MTFENYSYSKTIDYKTLKMPFGTYYLCEKFFIGELNEGIHFDWKKTELVVQKLIEHYGEKAKIGFISNRINHYSIDPSNWTKIEEKYNLIIASAIVMYNNSTYMNASIEKQFAKRSIKRCMSLQEALDWMLSLKEFH